MTGSAEERARAELTEYLNRDHGQPFDNVRDLQIVGRLRASARGEKYRTTLTNGRTPASRFRNMVIAQAVYRAWMCGLPQYASGNKTKLTACELVAEYMHMSPGAVKTIWEAARKQYGKPTKG